MLNENCWNNLGYILIICVKRFNYEIIGIPKEV